MSKLACFDNIKNPALKAKFVKSVDDSMTDIQQRDMGTDIALKEFEKLSKDLQSLKEEVNVVDVVDTELDLSELEIGLKLASIDNKNNLYVVQSIGFNTVDLQSLNENKIITVEIGDISKKYTTQLETVITNQKQLDTFQKLLNLKKHNSSLRKDDKDDNGIRRVFINGVPQNIAVTSNFVFINSDLKTGQQIKATFLGSIVDDIAKRVMNNENVSFDDSYTDRNGKSTPYSNMFKSKEEFSNIVKQWRNLKKYLDNPDTGYMYLTDVKLFSQSGINGEADLILIDKDGNVQVADFKTANNNYLQNDHTVSKISLLTKDGEFATQGYFYAEMLKEAGLENVKDSIIIFRQTLVYDTDSELAYNESPILSTDDVLKIDVPFTKLRNEFKGISLKDAVEVAKKLKKEIVESDGQVEEKENKQDAALKKLRRGFKGDTLNMRVYDNIQASSSEELKKEIADMKNMLGEDFVVNFVNEVNSDLYGDFSISQIRLFNNAIKGTGYHEGFHRFSQLYLTKSKKKSMYNSIRISAIEFTDRSGQKVNTKDLTDMGIEEMLADEWVKYTQSPSSYKFPTTKVTGIKSFFKVLWEYLVRFFSGNNPNRLFRDLYNGKYSSKVPDANNAIFGKLNSAIVDTNGKEIIHNTRTQLYISSVNSLVAKIIGETGYSFSSIIANSKDKNGLSTKAKLFNSVYNELLKVLISRENKFSLPEEYSTPEFENEASLYILNNKEDVFTRTITENPSVKNEDLETYYQQIVELNNILYSDENGSTPNYDAFIKFYVKRTNLDSIKGLDLEEYGVQNIFQDNEELSNIMTDEDAEEDMDEMVGESSEIINRAKSFDEAPNDKSAFQRAGAEVKDFFKTIASEINSDGTVKTELNELDIPVLLDYYSVFNKTKKFLKGALDIEQMVDILMSAEVQNVIPYSKTIAKKLQSYYENNNSKNNNSDFNFKFLRRFYNVMSLSEVDNYQVTINLNGLANDRLALITSEILSRNTSSKNINAWKANFKSSKLKDGKEKSTLMNIDEFSGNYDDLIKTNKFLFKKSNGDIVLNPFFDYNKWVTPSNYKLFLDSLGIELRPEMYSNSLSRINVTTVVNIILSNLDKYKKQAEENLLKVFSQSKYDSININIDDPTFFTSSIADVVDFTFINPLEEFTRRRELLSGEDRFEIFSIIPSLEALSQENEYYEPYAGAGSFVNDGKTKYPYYNPSVMTSRVALFNSIQNIKEFDDNFELKPWNPNKTPWMKRSLFLAEMFDSTGNRQHISKELRFKGKRLSEVKTKIELVELASYRVIDYSDRNKITNVHPRKLKGAEKDFFDIVSLYTNGLIEIPPAGTSSSMFAIKLNSYEVLRNNERGLYQNLPIKSITASLNDPRFRGIIKNYFLAEVEKLLWYKNNTDINLSQKNLDVLTNNLNIFSDIEFENDFIENFIKKAEKANKVDDVFVNNPEMLEDFINGMNKWFQKDINDLLDVIKQDMSPEQKLILQSLSSTVADTSSSADKDVKEANKEADNKTQKREGSQTVTDTTTRKLDITNLTNYRNIATNFIMNRFIVKQEYNILFMGDAYFFGKDLFKRGNYTTTTGSDLNINDKVNRDLNESKGETFHSVITGNTKFKDYKIIKSHLVSDVIRNSMYHEIMVNDLLQYQKEFGVANKLSKEELNKLHKPYQTINSADGQGKISLDFYKTIRKVWGEWSDNEEKEYQRQLGIFKLATKNLYKIVNGERLPLTEREIQKLKDEASKKPYATFNPQKIAFTGSQYLMGKDIQPYLAIFDKMSLAPIIPEMVYRSDKSQYDDRLPDADLLEEMSKTDTDYIRHVSASKILKSRESDIYNSLGSILAGGARLVDENSQYLFANGLKKQLNTDGMHSDDTFGSQQRKIVYDVKYLPEVANSKTGLNEYFDKLDNQNIKILDMIIEINRKSIIKKFGLSDYVKNQPLKIENKEIFAAAINDIIKNNGFPDSALKYLEYNEELGTQAFNIDLLYQRKELSQVIGGEIDKQLRRIKLKGTEAIQVTSVGNTVDRFKGASEAQRKKFGDTGLHFYHLNRNTDGSIKDVSAMGVKITLQGDFINLLELENNGKQIKVVKADGTLDYEKSLNNLNKALRDNNFRKEHQKQLTFYGYRIPTNNNNFLDRMEIMEFLPESAGNIIITPPEQMIKSGADFDIDKMHLIFPSITKDGKYLNQPEESLDSLYKKLYNRTKNVMSYKNEQKQIKTLVKDEKRDYKIVKEKRDNTLADIIEQFYVTNPNLYQTLSSNEELTIDGLIDAFYDEISSNEVIVNKIANYRTLDNLLRQASKINNERLIDNDFAEIFNKIQHHKDYMTNLLLDNYLELLSHPSYYQLLVRPSSSDMVKDVAKEIATLLKNPYIETYNSAENSTYSRTRIIHQNYRSDRNALGGFSIQRIWYSLLNKSKFQLNRSWVKSYKNGEFQMRMHMPLIEPDKRKMVFSGSDTLMMYGDNVEGISPRDIYDQLMSATIDLPSADFYTKLGINNNNKKIFNYLMDARVDFKTAVFFLNHPILKVLDEVFKKQKNQYGVYYYKNAMAQLAEVLDMGLPLSEKGGYPNGYMVMGKSNQIEKYDAFGDPIYKTIPVAGSNFHAHPGVYVDNRLDPIITDDVYFSLEDLTKDIKDLEIIMKASEGRTLESYRKQRTPEGKKRDIEILAYFMKVHMEADEMTKMKFAYSDDRNKNTHLLMINQSIAAKNSIRGNENNNIPVSGSIFDKDSILRIENESIFKTFNYTDFGKGMMSLLYKNLVQNGNNSLVFDRILTKSSSFGFQKEKLAERILDDYTEFIYKNYGKYEGTIYDPVTDTITVNTKPFSKYFLQSIFNVEGDLNHHNYALKQTNFFTRYPELRSIEFASRLEPRSGLASLESLNSTDKYNYSNITLARGDEKTLDMDNVYYEQFENLINFNPKFFNINKEYSTEDMVKISSYFTEMAYLSLYQSGQSNNGMNNFSHLVPVNIWSEFVGEAYEEFESLPENEKSYQTKSFGILFMENNPRSGWNNNKISYEPSKFLTDSSKDERKNDKDIRFFNNFTAGKNYLLETITPTQNLKLNEKDC